MSKQEHTPGPWSVDEGCHGFSIRPHRQEDGGRTGYQLAYIDGSHEKPYDVTVAMGGSPEANANLIAAAPELLEALEDMYEQCNMMPDDTWYRANARKAIAKARGEA